MRTESRCRLAIYLYHSLTQEEFHLYRVPMMNGQSRRHPCCYKLSAIILRTRGTAIRPKCGRIESSGPCYSLNFMHVSYNEVDWLYKYSTLYTAGEATQGLAVRPCVLRASHWAKRRPTDLVQRNLEGGSRSLVFMLTPFCCHDSH